MKTRLTVAVATILMLSACGTTPSAEPAPVVTVTEQAPQPADDTVGNGFTASENAFLDAVHSVNNTVIEQNTDEKIVEVGHTICDTLDNGSTVDEIVSYLEGTGDYSGDTQIEFAAAMIAGAVTKLCPEYSYQLQ